MSVTSNTPLKFLLDLALWGSAALLAYAFRQPGLVRLGIPMSVWGYLLLSVLVMAMLEGRYGLHRQTWRRVGVLDLNMLARAVALATLVMFALGFVLQTWLQLPRSVPVLAGVLGFLLMGGARLVARRTSERVRLQATPLRQRVLIVGAGEAGSLIAREMQRHPEAGLDPIGFLDDQPGKVRQRVVGLPVFGRVEELVEVAQREGAQEILIAVPSAAGEFVRRVVDLARDAGLRYRIIPGVFEILSGDVNINQIRDVNLEDLLRRPPVHLNTAEIAGYLCGRVVLVTGAGGSIGSEIVRQIVSFAPEMVLLFGRGENSIFGIQQELLRRWPDIKQVGLIGDVRDEARLRAVFEQYRPEVVFHAAAHKHVPLMEETPSEAILNNVVGTQNVVELCLEYGVTRLVNISTDKAVNPTSVMGASKRIAEMVVSAGAARARETQAFVSVRFGNVLGSRGSVVPTFMAQIRAGGPITVTHPDMVRYFMTIPEAARLVLQAGGLAENGKVYVLNMGDPVKIADLAHDVIRLSGAQNVDVVYSGIRPGEKLYEELLTSGEGIDATTHSEIFSAKLDAVAPEFIASRLHTLRAYALHNDAEAIRRELRRLIPENKFGSIR
ncbi:polysaccharide biosynthesis protein [Deinococcus metallilatus]|uniref:FlaA1/EpsC-like NDP-sugar epimerase n=1 Tax=Deinococcus metallilatus TaxID=1211322 RepID=A0AAJ5JXA0_9DEIO|nr:nucleoside-diphosphate sugar epimerase/dehydratase [Deinococcus metallilatus]MBB5297034.1 FlaA1/EpsC-like NDP-sugar epimerase [Deinococcus metallilatus]QBY07837.1 polysaccharide biosynthesis protein [Deinococcus metallilatus]RXJ13186.1 polysaccharide biosynthesis protein [Deinococcus metallilatus]TLK23041.1 polysaccharide biosynthesis protein [Deinococcus metallilatus]GMA16000.1 polysaccharide biosynthesis protein CapD [Deinococcus metallilatus]